jgi:hypothetical protein
VAALIVIESLEPSGECVCLHDEAYRSKRDLIEPDLLDLDTLYKAFHVYVYMIAKYLLANGGRMSCFVRGGGRRGSELWQVLSWSPWVFIDEPTTFVIFSVSL